MSTPLRWITLLSLILAILSAGPLACKGKRLDGVQLIFNTEHFEKGFQD
jgi:hypothetical protein